MLRILGKVKGRKSESVDLRFPENEGSVPPGAATQITRSKTVVGRNRPTSHLSSFAEVPMILDWQDPPIPSARPYRARTALYETEALNKALPELPQDYTPSRGATAPLVSLPLPTELMYLTIDNFLHQDVPTLLRLAKAVPTLRHHCWTHAFRSVKIHIRQREIARKKHTSNVDLFLQLLSRIPDIYPYVGELDIQDRGQRVWEQQGLTSSSQEDITTLSLLLVQTRRMTKLRSFRITTSLVWTSLPLHLKEAFFAMFTSCASLSEIALSGILLPVNLLALVKNLQVVDFQTGGVSPPIHHPSVASAPAKEVATMKIRDRNPFSNPMSLLGFKNHSFKTFSLAHLTQLEICLPGKHLEAVQEGLNVCMSLEVFKVFVGTAGGLPCILALDCLPRLRSLTLSADITNIIDRFARFEWVVKLLESIPSTSAVEDVNLLIRTPSLDTGKQCDWELLDALFIPVPPPELKFPAVKLRLTERDYDLAARLHWPSLRSFEVVWCTAQSQDIHGDMNSDFLMHLPIFLPNLYERGVMKMQTTYSDSQYNFWTYT